MVEHFFGKEEVRGFEIRSGLEFIGVIMNVKEISKLYDKIQSNKLKINTIICSTCGCILSGRSSQKPCEHLKKLHDDFQKGPKNG
jgi:hypothetical protein